MNNDNWLLTEFDQAYESLNDYSAVKLEREIASVDPSRRYDNQEFLAKGGMKSIFKVHDCLTDRTVAMARMITSDNKTIRELFVREGRINALLQHPNIVPVYDLGIDSVGEPYFVMKLLEGRTLYEIRNEHHNDLSIEEQDIGQNILLDKFVSVCEAVAYAHSCGVMHLDLKPSNIWCGSFGETMVGDWGLARVDEQSCADHLLESQLSAVSEATLYGMVKGTPGYLAPEMAHKLAPITTQADIFSLGAVLYFIVTGTIPFSGESNDEIICQTKRGDWKLPSERFPNQSVSLGLEAVISRAMATNPDDRYLNAVELVNEVRRYLAGFATNAEHAGFIRQFKLIYQRNRNVCRVIAASVILIFGLTATAVYRINSAMKVAEQNASVAKEIAQKLQIEKEERIRLGKSAARELYREARTAFLSSDMESARNAFEEAVELNADYDDVRYQLAGIYLHFLRFEDCLALLEKSLAKNRGTNVKQAYQIITTFYRNKVGEEYSADELMQLTVDLHRHSCAFLGRCLRETVFAKDLSRSLKIRFFRELVKSVNPRQKHWNFNVTEIKSGLSIDLSGNHEMLWIPGIHTLPIVELDISDCPISYFEQSYGLTINKLNLSGTNFYNLSFLKGMKLEEIHLSVKTQKALNVLMTIPTLKKVYIPFSLKDLPEIKVLKEKVQVIIE